MSKAGFWLRGSTGKLAGASLQKGANGETIMREIVTPKNPQTEAQMIQRIVMSTVMQAYSKMKDLCDHSFEGVSIGANTMAKFASRNANALRQRLAADVEQGYDLGSIWAFSPLGARALAPNEYIVSEGSLPGVDVSFNGMDGYSAKIPDIPGNTYRYIIENFGLRRGDQLTFMAISGATREKQVFDFARVILDPTNADGSAASLDVPFINTATRSINLPSPRNEGSFYMIDYTGSSNNWHIDFIFSGQIMAAAGIIVSRKNGDSWLRSTCQLVTDPSRVSLYYSMQDCLNMFEQGGVGVQSPYELNNAGTGAYVGGGVSGPVQFTLADNTTVDIVGLGTAVLPDADSHDTTFITLVDGAGNNYFIHNNNTSDRMYDKFAVNKGDPSVPSNETAWHGIATASKPANNRTVHVDLGNDVQLRNWQNLMLYGFNYTMWVSEP